MTAYHTETIEHAGMSFRVEHHHDSDHGEPWKEADFYGVVSDWTTRPKKPSECILATDGPHHRYYEIAESTALALRDSWGDGKPTSTRTKRQIAAAAVQKAFERLRDWCNDEWHWCGVVVTLLDTDGNKTSRTQSLWGIESDADEYLKEVAIELADEIADDVPPDGKLIVTVKA